MFLIALLLGVLCFSDGCDEFFEKERNSVVSPGYPENYPENVTCTYEFINTENCAVFVVEYLVFEIEDSIGCVNDRLEVGNQDAICGNKTGLIKNYKTDSNLLLKFISDEFQVGKGFNLFITKYSCEETATEVTTEIFEEMGNLQTTECCKDFYNQKRFYLTTPKFPFNNPLSDCNFRILKANDNICRLRLTFIYFSVGILDSSGCVEGYLEIDGKRMCGCNTGREIISSFKEQEKILHLSSNNPRDNKINGFVIEINQDECPLKFEKNPEIQQANLLHYSKPTLTEEVFLFDYQIDSYEPEETTFTDTVDVNFESGYDDSSCNFWTLKDLAKLNGDQFFRDSLNCASTSKSEDCVELKDVRGYFTSPGYPYGYPGNLDMCYKFLKVDGYCGFRTYFQDFCLEYSQNCYNDYLLFENNYKFCWQSLLNKVSTFDLRNKDFEKLIFKTNEFGNCRGFRGYYEQIPCQMQSNPQETCSKRTQEETFVLSALNQHQSCIFQIIKSNPNICRIELEILSFNLICGYENLIIKNKNFCGRPTTNLLVFNFENPTLQIKYLKFGQYLFQPGIRFAIRGRQISGNCYPSQSPNLPPPERITQIDPRNNVQYDLKLVVDEDEKEICDLVKTFVVNNNSMEKICDDLLKDERIIECKLLEAYHKTETLPPETKIRPESTIEMYLHGMKC